MWFLSRNCTTNATAKPIRPGIIGHGIPWIVKAASTKEDLTRIRRENPAFHYGFSGLIRLSSDRSVGKIRNMPPSLPEAPTHNKPKLPDQVRDVIRRKHFSIRTEQSYVDLIARFILFHKKRHPRDRAEAEVTQFLTYLARDGRVAASTQNQALSALLFLYKQVLKQEIGWLKG